jgi:hypothetical protein
VSRGRKLQIPTSTLQENPNHKDLKTPASGWAWLFWFEVSLELGGWNLELTSPSLLVLKIKKTPPN